MEEGEPLWRQTTSARRRAMSDRGGGSWHGGAQGRVGSMKAPARMQRTATDHRPIQNQPGPAGHSEKQCGGERQRRQWMQRAHSAAPPCRASTWWFLHRLMFSKTLGISPNDGVFADLWVVLLLFLAGGGECDPVIYSCIAFHDCCFPNDDGCGMNELLPHNVGVGSDF